MKKYKLTYTNTYALRWTVSIWRKCYGKYYWSTIANFSTRADARLFLKSLKIEQLDNWTDWVKAGSAKPPRLLSIEPPLKS